jgi:glycosyltransferase involved in cell wall biosynthesis
MIREKLSVLIPVYNEENLIKDCLESIKWADEILIIDSGSEDKTVEICRKYTNRILHHKYTCYADQVNWGIDQVKFNWVFLIDADERATQKLQNEIKNLLNNPSELNKKKAYLITPRHYFLGKWLRHGGRYPLYIPRLFQKTSHLNNRKVHPAIILDKKEYSKLSNDIIHLSDRSFEQYFEKFNKYTTYEAEEGFKNLSKKNKVDWTKFFTNYLTFKTTMKGFWIRLPLSSFFRFLYMYILKLGFLDGRKGFQIAVLYAFSDYVSKIKLKEMKKNNERY